MDIEIKMSDDGFQAKHQLTDISCTGQELYFTGVGITCVIQLKPNTCITYVIRMWHIWTLRVLAPPPPPPPVRWPLTLPVE